MSTPIPAARGRWSFLERPGAWFWCCVALGALLRGYCALATPGSYDLEMWSMHAEGVARRGLVKQYLASELFNHPPPIGLAMARLWSLCQALEWNFRDVLRVVVSVGDLGNVWLITRVLRESRWRWLAAGAYCVAPVAVVLSGHHGNTDPLIASCLLVGTLCAARQAAVRTGIAIGVSAWIKLPGLLAAPVLGFALKRTRDRIVCTLVATVVAVVPFFWATLEARAFVDKYWRRLPNPDRNIVWHNVVSYRGVELDMPGTTGNWLWGLRNLSARAFGPTKAEWPAILQWWHANNVLVALALIVAFACLRRRETSAPAIAATVAGVFAIFFALVDNVASQYFAWSSPFWMAAGWRFALASNLTAGVYVYALYALVTGGWLLRGEWISLDRTWPPALLALRDLAELMFLAFAAIWFARAAAAEFAFWRARRRVVEVDP